MKGTSEKYNFQVVIEHDDDGYFAFCPDVQGCYSQGDTRNEALKNIAEAIKGHLALSGGRCFR